MGSYTVREEVSVGINVGDQRVQGLDIVGEVTSGGETLDSAGGGEVEEGAAESARDTGPRNKGADGHCEDAGMTRSAVEGRG